MGLSDQSTEHLRRLVGAADDADEQSLLDAVERLTHPQAPAVPDGMSLIPTSALTDLHAAAERARELGDQMHARRRADVLNGYRDRFTPASRAAWEKQYDIDPDGTKAYLQGAPVIVPLSEIGYADGSEGDPDVAHSDTYKNWRI